MPVNPGAHVHSYESSLEVHSAPFLHGPEAQWSSNSQLGPVHDKKKHHVNHNNMHNIIHGNIFYFVFLTMHTAALHVWCVKFTVISTKPNQSYAYIGAIIVNEIIIGVESRNFDELMRR